MVAGCAEKLIKVKILSNTEVFSDRNEYERSRQSRNVVIPHAECGCVCMESVRGARGGPRIHRP